MATKQKLSGAYFTPDHLVAALSCWAVRNNADRLLDPSCGDGRFIANHQRSVGVEQDPQSAAQATDRAPWALVHEGDFFQWAAATEEKFECAAGNPPFVRYQNFNGDVRQRALTLCRRHGADFSGLTSSWAPFLVATASLLKRGGRMAFVVPAEIGHAPYAAPLLEYLVANFSIVHVIAIQEKLFPDLSEDCWLLYADGFGGRTENIRFTAMEKFIWSARPPCHYEAIDVDGWRRDWKRRLRPFLLSQSIRSQYAEICQSTATATFSRIANIGIGYVSGANDFFHLRPSEVEILGIPAKFLHASVRNAKALPVTDINRRHLAELVRTDVKFLLLKLPSSIQVPAQVRSYLDSAAGYQARIGYKCRNRQPWYSVPDVRVPHFMLSYMSGRTPQLVKNTVGATCTNSLHAIQIKDDLLAERLLPNWGSNFSQLSCEIEGHPLGGGMLKLEVREAASVQLIDPSRNLGKLEQLAIRDGVLQMRKWRHYARENL